MAVAARVLDVHFRNRRVGALGEDGASWRFEYDDAWLASTDAFDLSPALPRAARRIEDGGSQRPVQWFFDNLLPEEDARALLAQEARVPQADAFGLLGYYGAESAGALTLLPPGTDVAAGGLQPLPDDALSQRIRALPRHSLGEQAPKRMSMAGAQHKLPAVLLPDGLHEPVGATPSTVILKPDHVQVERYAHSAANEWFCMALARAVGLPVPDVFLRYVPEPVYGVQRLDRDGTWPDVQRRHVLDACQLLSLDRIFKYQQSSAATLAQLVALCREKARTRLALLRWTLFNALVGNGDAHLKNLSFFVAPNGIALAPHYDLLSTASYADPGRWGAAELSFPMGTARHFGDLRRDGVFAVADTLGIPARVAALQVDALLQRIGPAAEALVGQFETATSPVRRAGEQRQIRLVVAGVLREMCAQLA